MIDTKIRCTQETYFQRNHLEGIIKIDTKVIAVMGKVENVVFKCIIWVEVNSDVTKVFENYESVMAFVCM